MFTVQSKINVMEKGVLLEDLFIQCSLDHNILTRDQSEVMCCTATWFFKLLQNNQPPIP